MSPYRASLIVYFLLILAPFALAQTDYPLRPDGTNAVRLAWEPPEARKDGTPLPQASIGGYEILYRVVGTSTWLSEDLSDGTLTEWIIADLPAGEFEFAIAVYDTQGVYSEFTAGDRTIVIEDIPPPNPPTQLDLETTLFSQIKAWYDCVALDHCEAEVRFTLR